MPIESREAINRELVFLIEEEIITEQVEPTPWVSSVMFLMKPNGEVQGMSGSKQLEQGHHQRASQAHDSRGNCTRIGWSNGLHEGRCFEGIPTDTSQT